jgi:hypothetical protein
MELILPTLATWIYWIVLSVKAELAQSSDIMSEKNEFENEDFEKKFSEIVNSNELKEISDSFTSEVKLGVKELLLIQQALSDNISNITEVIIASLDGENMLGEPDSEISDILGSLYKISEDFNDCMTDNFISFVIVDDEDEDFEDGTE